MTRRTFAAVALASMVAAASTMGALAGAEDGDGQPAHDPSITEGIECGACHTPEGWRVAGAMSDGAGFDHSRTGFPLSGRHRTVSCTNCHVPGQQVTRDCFGCHQDFHQGRLGRSCDRCHSSVSWRRTRPIELHRLTRLPLTGMHVLAACTDCHQRTTERQYSSAPAECYACHDDEYHDPTVHPNHDGTAGNPPFPRDCAQCHRAIGWSPAIVDPTVLPRSSGLTSAPRTHDIRFPISFGPHRGAPCQSCHLSGEARGALACTGCHAHSPLQLRQDHRTVPAVPDAGACLGCHPGGRAR